MKQTHDEVFCFMDFISIHFNTFNAKFNEISVILQKIDVLQNELTDLEKENWSLKQETEDLQYLRRNNIEINEIPERNRVNYLILHI